MRVRRRESGVLAPRRRRRGDKAKVLNTELGLLLAMCDCEELEYDDFVTMLKEIETVERARPRAEAAPLTVSVRRRPA